MDAIIGRKCLSIKTTAAVIEVINIKKDHCNRPKINIQMYKKLGVGSRLRSKKNYFDRLMTSDGYVGTTEI